MVADRHDEPPLLVVGVTHRTAPASLRERLFVEPEDLPRLLGRLGKLGLTQALALSTCDRVEVFAIAADAETAMAPILRALADQSGLAPAEIEGRHHRLNGAAALRHLFSVAASLDSRVIGEPEVLGQVHAADRAAREAGLIGAELDQMLQAAYGAAKRVRTQTAIAEGPASLAAAAARLARDIHGDLSELEALLVGPGEMGLLLFDQLQGAGLRRWTAIGRTARRAEALARRLGGHYATIEELAGRLAQTDIVITAEGAGRHLIDAAMVEAALRRRRRRPIFLVDAAVPGDIERTVDAIEGAFRYDLEDLERVASEGQAARRAAIAPALALVDEALARFMAARRARAAVPAVAALRQHFERLRAEVLRETAADDAARATELLIQRLLHEPSQALRAAALAGEDAATTEHLLRRLFRIDPVDEEVGR
jgi:glutamyl-tRNA reductase